MKNSKKIMAICLTSFSCFTFAQNTSEINSIFSSQSAELQDRICSELLVELAKAAAQKKDKKQLELAQETATQGAILLSVSSNISKTNKDKAKEINKKIDLLPVKESINIGNFCISRSNYLINTGKISAEKINEASILSNQILSKYKSK